MSKYPKRMAREGNALWAEVELSPGCGNTRWKTCSHKIPRQSGSRYYNYKGFYSVVLLSFVDADYRLLWTDIGSNGCCSNTNIYNACQLDFPDPLTGDDRDMPYFIVANDAFALRTWQMKPAESLMINNTSSTTDCPGSDRWWGMPLGYQPIALDAY